MENSVGTSNQLINASEDPYYPPNLGDAFDKQELSPLLPEGFDEIISIPNRVLYDMTRNSDNMKKVKTGKAQLM